MADESSSNAIMHIKKKKDFEATIQAHDLVVIDAWAPWCGPCVGFAPTFEEYNKKYENVLFVKVNVDEAKKLTTELGISGIPAFFFFKKGERQTDLDLVGADESAFAERLKKLVA